MAGMFEYKCPSCGALLKISPEESFVKCSYCGTIVERELNADEQAKASAKKLAKKVEQYKTDMHELDRLKDSLLSKDQKIRELEGRSKVESGFMRENPKVVPVIIAICGVMYLFGNGESKLAGLIGCLIAAAIVYFCTINGKETAEREASQALGQIDSAKKDLAETQEKYDKLKKRFDPNFIPDQYRNDQALDYVLGLFQTEQASSLGEAFKRYEEYLHQKKMESLQQEQIALQKQQIEKLDHISEKKSEEEIGKTAAKAGAAVVGTVIAGKIVKEIFKNL